MEIDYLLWRPFKGKAIRQYRDSNTKRYNYFFATVFATEIKSGYDFSFLKHLENIFYLQNGRIIGSIYVLLFQDHTLKLILF